MKKLLGILGTITITGSGMAGIVGNAPISVKNEINYLQTNNLEKLNRNKRSWNSQSRNENKINRQCYWHASCDYWLWISRENWNKTQKIYKKSNNFDQFKNPFFNIIKNFWRECKENELWGIVQAIWNDFQTINNEYNSSKINYGLYMKIYKGQRLARGSRDLSLQCFSSCPSNKFENIEEFIKNTNLGALNDNNQITILTAVKSKNSNLDISQLELVTILTAVKSKNSNLDISQLELVNITNTSATIKAKNNSDKYYNNKKIYFTLKPDLITDFKTCIAPVDNNDDETILAAVKTKNPNLDISQVYVKEKVINGKLILGVKNTSNKYNINSSGWCDFKVKPNLKFLGLGDNYKGEISLDTVNKNIRFFGNSEQFHNYFDGQKLNSKAKVYNKIVILNQKNKVIKKIIINGTDSMKDIINKYNLQNGIAYQDGYLIEIWAAEPERTNYFINNDSSTLNDNKIIFKIIDNKIIKHKYNLKDFLNKVNLGKINDNTNNAILNELNYLNHNLDISQLEITNIRNNSAIIKAKNESNKYFGEKKVHYTINNKQNKIINLNELIKKGIFLSFRDKNKSTTLKEIKNINTNDLIYSDITVTKNIEPTYTKNSKSICFGTATLFHNLSEKQNMKTPSCKYTKETTISTQITTGLSNTNGTENTTEKGSGSSNVSISSSTEENSNKKIKDIKHNWSFELGVNVHGEAGVWPFAKVSTDINSKVGTGGEYGSSTETSSSNSKTSSTETSSSTTNASSESKILSNTFDFSDSKTNEFKEISEVELPSQEIKVKPNQKIKVIASLDEILAQVTLNLKQTINGEVNSEIINENNEKTTFKISIKEIMQKLKQYGILPQEITINNDDTITFNGKASKSLKQGFDGNIEFREVK